MSLAWRWLVVLGIGLCAGCGPSDGAVSEQPQPESSQVVTETRPVLAGGLEHATPAQLCAAGCERVDRCRAELLPGHEQAVRRCHRECARLDQGRREGVVQLRACLSVEGCEAFAVCLDSPPGAAGTALASIPQGEDLTPCEAVCGAYGDCSSRTGRASLDIAARLEMRCLARCQQLASVPAGDRADTPQVAPCDTQTGCDGLIECVQRAISSVPSENGRDARNAVAARPVCELVCEKVVSCQDLDGARHAQQREAVAQCSEKLCQQQHEPALLRRIESCVQEADCSAFMKCLYQLS